MNGDRFTRSCSGPQRRHGVGDSLDDGIADLPNMLGLLARGQLPEQLLLTLKVAFIAVGDLRQRL